MNSELGKVVGKDKDGEKIRIGDRVMFHEVSTLQDSIFTSVEVADEKYWNYLLDCKKRGLIDSDFKKEWKPSSKRLLRS